MRIFVGRLMLAALLFGAALVPAAAQVAAQDATAEATSETITLVPYTDETFGVNTVVPEGWTSLGNGLHARQSSATDATVLAIQAAPLRADALLNALLPQLALTEAPESVGTYEGQNLDWTLYQVDVSAAGMTIHVDLALGEAEGTTYLVLLQSVGSDYDVLHEAVFLPILDSFALAAEEATEEPVPYVVEDVTFDNDNGNVTLAGTLTLPPTDGPHPVVVLVTGSGPQDRDETLAGVPIKPFRLIADALTRAGVAVLRYDDRGVAQSTGDFAAATTADFASDAEAAIAYLLTRDDIDPDQIGLLGHSEGGLVAAMLGASNADLDFIISMAGPGVSGLDVLLLQNELILEAAGATEEEVSAQVNFLSEFVALMDEGDMDAVYDLVYAYNLETLEALPEEDRAQIGDLEAYAETATQQFLANYGSAWFGSFLSYDPAPDWAQTVVPVLAIFGGKDLQVDAEQNAPALEAALVEAGNEDYEIVVLPDANHLFQSAETGSPTEYSELADEFTPDFLPTILEWLETHVTVAGA